MQQNTYMEPNSEVQAKDENSCTDDNTFDLPQEKNRSGITISSLALDLADLSFTSAGLNDLYKTCTLTTVPLAGRTITQPRVEESTHMIAAVAPQTTIPPMPQVIVQNVVATVDLDNKSLDLKKIAISAKNSDYNPKRFSGLIMRIRDPRTTALIFKTGKLVCLGAKSCQDAETATKKYAKIIKKLGFEVRFKNFKVQNIVGSCSLNFAVNLYKLSFAHAKFCTLDEETFPGLIYRLEKPKVVLLIFANGKVVITGAKNVSALNEALAKMYSAIWKFKTQSR